MTTEEIRKAWIAEHLEKVHIIDREAKALEKLSARRSFLRKIRSVFSKRFI